MTESQLYVFLAFAVVVVALAMLVIAYCGYQALMSLRRMERRSEEFFDQWMPVAQDAGRFLEHFSIQSGELLARLNELTARLQEQSLQVDSAVRSISVAARRNAQTLDTGLRQLLRRIDGAAQAIENGVRAPVRQLRAVGIGVSAAMRSLLPRRSRTAPDRISADEEMFL